MSPEEAVDVGIQTFVYSVYAMVGILLFLCLLLFIGWLWTTKKKAPMVLSPYTGFPLYPAMNVNYQSLVKIYRYMEDHESFENQQIQFKKALVCRDTGRIFPNCINFWGKANLDWSFLQNHHNGFWVSWGSLSDDQQRHIREAHTSLDGFQTDFSCPEPLPKDITPEYAYAAPGPLYVDIATMHLLGWKEIPGTSLEVLIVQKPKPSLLDTDIHREHYVNEAKYYEKDRS